MQKTSNVVRIFLIASFMTTLCAASEVQRWRIILSREASPDAALKLAIEDLTQAGAECGLEFQCRDDQSKIDRNAIIVGDVPRNKLLAELVGKGAIQLETLAEPQAYQIRTLTIDGKRTVIVAGGSIIGDVYGLYWIWDRLRVQKCVPDLNVTHIPALKIRYAGGGSEEALRAALRYRATWVSCPYSVNQLVPWNAEPEGSENAIYREKAKKYIAAAHALHFKVLVHEDEFSYHPTLLEEFSARPTPSDPVFWDAVQAKYRRLLQAMPEIDGIRVRTGESTRIGGNFKGLDVMHEGEGCDWSLEKRYRIYVRKMHNVIVGEFDKIYFQRTWVTSAHEQHSQADVYKSIFTDEIPTKNLYLSPYLSQTDRYFHQPYNPTFNQTPHDMVVLLATLDYHARGDDAVFPSYPGQWFQAGLQTILAPAKSNVKGSMFGVPETEGWGTSQVTAYVASRLSWDPNAHIRAIARDFAAIHFGEAAADAMAEIYLLSPVAYKYGIYIEPVAYGEFNSLPHMRLNTFPAFGLPRLDNGKEHIAFLRKLYLRCKPWATETLMYLDHGLDVADQMVMRFQPARSSFSDPKIAEAVYNSLLTTQRLIKANNRYVKTFFAYFAYREQPTELNRQQLYNLALDLKSATSELLQTPGCNYELSGMEQLLLNVNQALTDLKRAETLLAQSPDPDEINLIVADEQQKYAQACDKYAAELVHVLHWKGRVDGRDLLRVKGDQLEIIHLRYDPIQEMTFKFSTPLPAQAVTVLPKIIQARSFKPFILEQPSAANNYTVTVYLSDYPCHGYSWWEFDLYSIPRPPEEIGMVAPWRK